MLRNHGEPGEGHGRQIPEIAVYGCRFTVQKIGTVDGIARAVEDDEKETKNPLGLLCLPDPSGVHPGGVYLVRLFPSDSR